MNVAPDGPGWVGEEGGGASVVRGGRGGASVVGGGGGVTLVDTKILNSNTFIIFITFPSHAGACKVHIAISM